MEHLHIPAQHRESELVANCLNHLRLGLRSVLGLGLALGSCKVYHTAGRMLILHRYRTPVAVCIASFPITA